MRQIHSTGNRCGAFSEGEISSTVNCDDTSWHGISVQLVTFDVSLFTILDFGASVPTLLKMIVGGGHEKNVCKGFDHFS